MSRNFNENTKIGKYFQLLSDNEFHCRNCAGRFINSSQPAGDGGIQGLKRAGIDIETRYNISCSICGVKGAWDRWTGKIIHAYSASGIPDELAERIIKYYKNTDSIEGRRRQPHELVIDHRFPMNRWIGEEDKNSVDMPESEIQRKFQLLKKDSSGNHNKLKTEACNKCLRTGKRGYPMGIKFFYFGNENWDDTFPRSGAEAEKGCIGCGWYDFEQWRSALNGIF